VATDAYNNKSEMHFTVRTRESEVESQISNDFIYLSYEKENLITSDNINFKIPNGALYSNHYIKIDSNTTDSSFYSPFYIIGNELMPMHKYPELAIKIKTGSSGLQSEKLIIARYDTNGNIISEGGRWKNGWVSAKVNGFGKYTVIADTIAPEIIPVSFKNNGWYAAGDKLVFKIKDGLSGIKTYNGYIDDTWVLFEYDAKSDNLFYTIDHERLERTKSKHDLKIYVMDERNNITTLKGFFYY
jgi:hypothetical protein